MAERNHTLFSTLGSMIAGVGASISVAREVNRIYNTPESAFRARGTTRDAAVRAAVKRL